MQRGNSTHHDGRLDGQLDDRLTAWGSRADEAMRGTYASERLCGPVDEPWQHSEENPTCDRDRRTAATRGRHNGHAGRGAGSAHAHPPARWHPPIHLRSMPPTNDANGNHTIPSRMIPYRAYPSWYPSMYPSRDGVRRTRANESERPAIFPNPAIRRAARAATTYVRSWSTVRASIC